MTGKPPPEDKAAVSGPQILREGIEDWRLVLDRLVARFETRDFSTGAALVGAIAIAADEANHHPDVDLRYPHLTVSLLSHDVAAITQRDIRLARRISELAADAGVRAANAPDVIELALDTPDHAAVKPFWQAMLGYEDRSSADDDELRDNAARHPSLWFQQSDAEVDAPDRQRWHLDISVPAEQAEARVQAAIAAGGTLVSDEAAPRFWVLADPEGNKGCICTWQGRSQWADQNG